MAAGGGVAAGDGLAAYVDVAFLLEAASAAIIFLISLVCVNRPGK